MIILDTNVLSETLRPTPSARVLEWMRSEPASALFTTAITESELLYGIALLPEGRRRQSLESVVDLIFAEDLAGRVLPFDSAAAREFADIAASRRRAGRPISEADARIAAIARSRGGALATRNVGDFVGCRLELIDPWA
jgi:predicted nucleic acid-binding protein